MQVVPRGQDGGTGEEVVPRSVGPTWKRSGMRTVPILLTSMSTNRWSTRRSRPRQMLPRHASDGTIPTILPLLNILPTPTRFWTRKVILGEVSRRYLKLLRGSTKHAILLPGQLWSWATT